MYIVFILCSEELGIAILSNLDVLAKWLNKKMFESILELTMKIGTTSSTY